MRYLIIVVCLFLTGCSQLGYLAQATRGQLEITFSRKPIDEVLSNSQTAPQTRERLELVKRIRKFAVQELDLPENSSYTTYSELGRRYVIWNVIAAPPYDLTLKTWCYPITGCISYRGYFSEKKADVYQESLIEKGYDTDLYGVAAYSTLGWLSDPVLDTFLFYPDYALAGLIFHELAHQVLYVKDDSAFNEAFATAVEQEGVERWMRAEGNSEQISQYRAAREKNARIIELILDYRKRLGQAYANPGESGLAEEKARVLREMTGAYQSLSESGYGTRFWDQWFEEGVNNARLGGIATYHRLVPAFRAVLSKSESMAVFYKTVADQVKTPIAERHAWLQRQMHANDP
ncbi:MAG: aminopeptidase [Gammaproteobacteria bacterium]|nr:aminopeptidase [Gammaproteobacteria bacterium]MCY4312968.1 aminopeptidase [Gammaproteobacteria bacterium]